MARIRGRAGHRRDVLHFLLGYATPIAEIDGYLAAGEDYDPFYEFAADSMSSDEFLALWRRHLSALVVEAHRLGIALPNPESYQPYPRGCWVQRPASARTAD